MLARLALLSVPALIIACGADAASPDTPEAVDQSVRPTAIPAALATPAALPTAAPPPAFNLADYLNGSEIEGLIAEMGPERSFPAELMEGSPELSQEDAALVANEYLLNTRVVWTDGDLIDRVSDFCGGEGARNTGTHRFTPQLPDGEWNEGGAFLWEFGFNDFTEWNQPRLVEPGIRLERAAYFARGIDGVRGSSIFPPEVGQPPTDFEGRFIRVFELPGCREWAPVKEYSPAQWELLGFGELGALVEKRLPDVLRSGQPQLESKDLLAAWHEYGNGIITMDNLTGLPAILNCDGETAMWLNRYASTVVIGRTEPVEFRDARVVATNAVWVVHVGNSLELLIPEQFEDPYAALLSFDAGPDCDLELGRDYIRRINSEQNLGLSQRLEWIDE